MQCKYMHDDHETNMNNQNAELMELWQIHQIQQNQLDLDIACRAQLQTQNTDVLSSGEVNSSVLNSIILDIIDEIITIIVEENVGDRSDYIDYDNNVNIYGDDDDYSPEWPIDYITHPDKILR